MSSTLLTTIAAIVPGTLGSAQGEGLAQPLLIAFGLVLLSILGLRSRL